MKVRRLASDTGNARLFSLRHEFPTQWAQLRNSEGDEERVELRFEKRMFPYWSGDSSDGPNIIRLGYYAASGEPQDDSLASIASSEKFIRENGVTRTTADLPTVTEDIWMLATWTIDH